MTLDLSKQVKLTNPGNDERDLIFKIDTHKTVKGWVYITCLNLDLPSELVLTKHITNI